MRLFTHTIWIAKSPDAVFDFFADFAMAPRWRRFVSAMRLTSPPPLGVGSLVSVTMELAGSTHDFTLTVLTFDRPRVWRHRMDDPHYDGSIEYTFAPDGSGTRVTMTMSVTPTGVYGWLGLPLVLLRGGKAYAGQLPNLKRAIEEPTHSARTVKE
jgi:hypothetical protein